MKVQSLHRIGALLLALGLAGCSAHLHTPYTTPEVQLPPSWASESAGAAMVRDQWWKTFNDPELNRLIEEVLRRNNDLAAAAIVVRKALLQAELADSSRLPGVAVEGSASHSHDLQNKTRETNTFGASVQVSYEVDLWGKLANTADAAQWTAVASEEDRASTALSLVASTASLYWQIGYLNQRVTLSQASIDYARQTLELVRLQKSAGAATALELLEAERSLAAQEASHTTLVQQRVETRHALAILLDSPPQRLHMGEPQDLVEVRLPDVAAGMPATLLARRPDLRAAEARLRSLLATTDATRASFYPTFTLSGSLGRSSEELSRVLSNPIGTVAADLALPFVQWRDMRRTVKISEADYEQAVVSFRQTLYSALAEVENSLSARQQYLAQAEKLEQALQAARKTEDLYRIRYQAGGSPLRTWLDAQEDRRQAEINLAENRLNQIENHITLVKALGGDSSGAGERSGR
jgi:NodT family efflux transporter outer membrane factor (OMF) lipoprotein